MGEESLLLRFVKQIGEVTLHASFPSRGLYVNLLSNFAPNPVGFLAGFSCVCDSSHLLYLFSFDSKIISPQCIGVCAFSLPHSELEESFEKGM